MSQNLDEQVEWFLTHRVNADDIRELLVFMTHYGLDEFMRLGREYTPGLLKEAIDNGELEQRTKEHVAATKTPVIAQWLHDKGYEIVLPKD